MDFDCTLMIWEGIFYDLCFNLYGGLIPLIFGIPLSIIIIPIALVLCIALTPIAFVLDLLIGLFRLIG